MAAIAPSACSSSAVACGENSGVTQSRKRDSIQLKATSEGHTSQSIPCLWAIRIPIGELVLPSLTACRSGCWSPGTGLSLSVLNREPPSLSPKPNSPRWAKLLPFKAPHGAKSFCGLIYSKSSCSVWIWSSVIYMYTHLSMETKIAMHCRYLHATVPDLKNHISTNS